MLLTVLWPSSWRPWNIFSFVPPSEWDWNWEKTYHEPSQACHATPELTHSKVPEREKEMVEPIQIRWKWSEPYICYKNKLPSAVRATLPGRCGDTTGLPHVVLRFKNNYEIEKSQSRQPVGGSLISVHCNITTAELKNLRRFPFFPLVNGAVF